MFSLDSHGTGGVAGSLGTRVMARLDALAAFTSEPAALTRLYLTPAHKAAALQVAAWMEEAGMATRFDAAGTVVGRVEAGRPDAADRLAYRHGPQCGPLRPMPRSPCACSSTSCGRSSRRRL
ncbi:hypothetical protein [Methylobacterium nigriterrae]|uniref:hypothetical protein n=1 Tax=Methylobacterium nigriterrae TaxID=3127512 RepID=UPI003013E965